MCIRISRNVLVEDRADSLLRYLVLAGFFAGILAIAACSEMVGFGRFTAQEETQVAASPPVPQGSGLAPAALMGKPASEVETLLGRPTLLREEEGAQVWQYASTSCVLLLYLYENDFAAYQVTHMEARAKGDGPSDVAGCLAATPAS